MFELVILGKGMTTSKGLREAQMLRWVGVGGDDLLKLPSSLLHAEHSIHACRLAGSVHNSAKYLHVTLCCHVHCLVRMTLCCAILE